MTIKTIMADEIDSANAYVEAEVARALAAQARIAESTRLPRTGKCHYCAEPLNNEEGLFCDTDCAKDWDEEQNRRRRQGG